MFGEPLFGVVLIFALFAIGEFFSVITKARIPMLFIVLFGYLILMWTGVFPTDILERSDLAAFAALIPAPLVVHMGTLIPFKQIKEQYKAVLISIAGIVVAAILIFIVCIPIIGYSASVAGAGPLTGGIIATVVTSEGLTEVGLPHLVTITALVMGLQNLVGIPLTVNLLRRYGFKIQRQMKQGSFKTEHSMENNENPSQEEDTVKKKSLIPVKYQTQIILLFQVFLGGGLAILLDNLTGLNYSIWALAIGIIGTYFNFYQGNMLERANSFGVSLALIIVVVMTLMDDISPSMFTTYLPHVLLIMVVGIGGIFIGAFVVTKLLKWDPHKGISVALTALFGFPGDYIICEEVSRSIGKNEHERKTIFNEVLTPMLIGGFTTVTFASIIVASILVSTL